MFVCLRLFSTAAAFKDYGLQPSGSDGLIRECCVVMVTGSWGGQRSEGTERKGQEESHSSVTALPAEGCCSLCFHGNTYHECVCERPTYLHSGWLCNSETATFRVTLTGKIWRDRENEQMWAHVILLWNIIAKITVLAC